MKSAFLEPSHQYHTSMNPIPLHRTENHSEETSMLAYHLWQQANCPPSQDLHFWLNAERQLFGNREQQPAASAAKAVIKRAAAPTGNGSVKSLPGTARKPARAR
jgi:hypothetical protein